MTLVSNILHDQTIIHDMRKIIGKHLSAALMECAAASSEFKSLESTSVMNDLYKYLDPNSVMFIEYQDDAFHEADKATSEDSIELARGDDGMRGIAAE